MRSCRRLDIYDNIGLLVSARLLIHRRARRMHKSLVRLELAIQRNVLDVSDAKNEGDGGKATHGDPDDAQGDDVGVDQRGFDGIRVGHGAHGIDEGAGVAGPEVGVRREIGVVEQSLLEDVLEDGAADGDAEGLAEGAEEAVHGGGEGEVGVGAAGLHGKGLRGVEDAGAGAGDERDEDPLHGAGVVFQEGVDAHSDECDGPAEVDGGSVAARLCDDDAYDDGGGGGGEG